MCRQPPGAALGLSGRHRGDGQASRRRGGGVGAGQRWSERGTSSRSWPFRTLCFYFKQGVGFSILKTFGDFPCPLTHSSFSERIHPPTPPFPPSLPPIHPPTHPLTDPSTHPWVLPSAPPSFLLPIVHPSIRHLSFPPPGKPREASGWDWPAPRNCGLALVPSPCPQAAGCRSW